MKRTSYRALSQLPAFGLFKDEELVATIRAVDIQDARELFKRHGLAGDRVKRLPGQKQ